MKPTLHPRAPCPLHRTPPPSTRAVALSHAAVCPLARRGRPWPWLPLPLPELQVAAGAALWAPSIRRLLLRLRAPATRKGDNDRPAPAWAAVRAAIGPLVDVEGTGVSSNLALTAQAAGDVGNVVGAISPEPPSIPV